MTELVFILDRSGSMAGLEADTIGGFNAMLEKQRRQDGEALVSTVLFDGVTEVLHDRVPLDRVPLLTDKTYTVRGCTALLDAVGGAIHHIGNIHALLDAVGGAIHHIGNIHKYARREDVPEKTIFVITTDGMENASRRYSYEKVKQMIARQQKKYGWEFLFLGANIDAAKEAGRMGIAPTHAVTYTNDSAGVRANYESVTYAVSAMRSPFSGLRGLYGALSGANDRRAPQGIFSSIRQRCGRRFLILDT